MLAVHAALERMAAVHQRMAQVVEYRFFGGMTEEEIAHLLGVSERTVRGDWQRAKICAGRESGRDPIRGVSALSLRSTRLRYLPPYRKVTREATPRSLRQVHRLAGRKLLDLRVASVERTKCAHKCVRTGRVGDRAARAVLAVQSAKARPLLP
jgi:hypothetical protein